LGGIVTLLSTGLFDYFVIGWCNCAFQIHSERMKARMKKSFVDQVHRFYPNLSVAVARNYVL